MKMQQRKVPLFWVIYAVVVFLLICTLTVGASVLNAYLEAFENSQPIHSAQEVFDRYFVNENFEEALSLASFQGSDMEDLSVAAEALKQRTEGKVMSFYAASSEEGEANYNVVLINQEDLSDKNVAGEEVKDATAEMKVHGIPSTKIATLSFKKGETKGDFGFYGYEFQGMEIFLEGKEEAKVTLPSGYTLFVNENEVNESYLEDTSAHEWNEYLPEKTAGITLENYHIGGLLFEPTLRAEDEEGNEVALTLNEKSGVWESAISYETRVDEDLSQRILAGMKAYATYMQDDGSIGAVSPYFDRTSEFYKNTASNPSSFVWDHNGYEFQNEVVDEFYFFDENTLCCHVSFDQVLKMTGKENYVDHLDMTVFVRKVGNSWRIYDRIVR